MAPLGTRFEVQKFDGTGNFSLWQTRVKDLLAQQGCLKALRKVKPAKMELSCDGRKFMEDNLGASSVSCSRTYSDRCESVGIEDDDGISDNDIGV